VAAHVTPTARPGRITPAQRRALLAHVKAETENRPGTYRMLAEGGRVLYVGKSRRLRTRLLSYFRAKGRRSKAARILRHAFAIEWEYAPNEFAALLQELRLIKQHRPHFNSAMVSDEWPRAYVALTAGPVPGLRVVRRTDDARAEGMWGPFRRVTFLRDAVHALAEITGVRDCALDDPGPESRARPLWFADTPAPRGTARLRTPGCLRAELGSCPGPCIGRGAEHAYHAQVAAARAFLDAHDSAPLEQARARMQEASALLQFERAGAWRDKAERLEWLFGRVSKFQASMDRLTFRYDALGDDGTTHVYLVRRGTVRAEQPAPQNAHDEQALATLAQRVFHGPDPKGADVPMHDLDEFYLVASWFRRRPEELARTAQP
jgi:excinuclease ABC subunit C